MRIGVLGVMKQAWASLIRLDCGMVRYLCARSWTFRISRWTSVVELAYRVARLWCS